MLGHKAKLVATVYEFHLGFGIGFWYKHVYVYSKPSICTHMTKYKIVASA